MSASEAREVLPLSRIGSRLTAVAGLQQACGEFSYPRQRFMKRRSKDLSPAEVLALAISLEEEDARLYQEFARVLRPDFPALAAQLDQVREQENSHRH